MALSNLTKVQTLGIGSNIEVVGVITTGQFKSGTSNLHASGVELTNLNVSGIATIGGNVSIGGTLTYQDVTNIDSVGIITARSNIDCNGDLDVDGHTELDNINIAGVATFSQGGSEVVRINSGGLLLYNDLSFFGASTHAYWDHSSNQFILNDNTKLSVGSSSDLQIYHGSNISTINDSYGDLRIMSNTLRLQRQAGGENFLYATEGGKVSLFYDGSQKFETTNTGVVISGICTATSFSGDGSNLTGITGTTINGNADNRVITGSGTANTLNAEGNFLHDPTTCDTTIQHYEALKVVDLIVKNTNNHGNAAGARITIESGSAANTGPQFEMICGSHKWSMQVPKAAGNLEFNNNGTLDFLMADDGDFHVVDGDVVFSTAGHGIDFSATSDASGGTSELFNDYEVGTWSPVANGFTASGTYHANYTKIGRLVHITMWVQTASGSSGSPFYISGLPYTVRGGTNCYQYACGRLGSNSYTNSQSDIVFEFTPNNTTIFPKVQDGGMNWGMASGTHVMITGSYITD